MNDGVIGEESTPIETADPSAAPTWEVFGKAIGGVTTPGDLFYIDADQNADDILVTLYLTNAKELSHCYQYLILEVGAYTETDAGEWERATGWDGEPIPANFITLHNGEVSYTLPGHAKYKVTLDGGSFYCTTTKAEGGSTSPNFYLTVD